MSCCGNKRNNLTNSFSENTISVPQPYASEPVIVEYLGKNKMAITGPISKKTYSFYQQGQRVMIDPMDVEGFEGKRKFLVRVK